MRMIQKPIRVPSASKSPVFIRIVEVLLIFAALSYCQQLASAKTRVTVADAIAMTRIAGTPYPSYSPKTDFALFSPNGKLFAIVISRGDLKNDANDYSLLVFRTNHLAAGSMPKALTTFASTSNRAGIASVTWRDNDTLVFLGSERSDPTELYSIRYSTGRLTKLTDHRQSVVSYGFSENGGTLVYAANRPERPVITNKTLHYGFDVGSEWVSDIIRGTIADREPEIFLTTRTRKDVPVRTKNPFDSGINDLFVAPNGRYVVVKTDTVDVPSVWREYDDAGIQSVFRRGLFNGRPSRILRYELINLRTGKSTVLLNSPTTYWSQDVLWAPDSKSLLLCGTWLPLDAKAPAETEKRRANKFVVEIAVTGRWFTTISDQDLEPLDWDARTDIVRFRVRPKSPQAGVLPEIVYYRKSAGAWKQVTAPSSSSRDTLPEIYLDEDLNLPPRIMVMDPGTKKKTVLVDLDPQLRNLALGQEQLIHWKTSDGRSMNGGLYLPTDYVRGKRYPLVIQTHGFDRHEFWIDGPYSSAFAARPLASNGIAVLQMDDISSDALESPEEPKRAMEDYLSAIRYLDLRGIIDPRRVGIIGFSRTCLYVEYALTHASGHFAAAVITDGVDAGYFQYLLSYTANSAVTSDSDAVVGAPPFGAGLSKWLKNSPGFLLDRVTSPILIQAIGQISLLSEWQLFAGLRRLGKPVDMVYLPTGVHILVKPWDRMVSQQGTVDWFCFWLKGRERRDPATRDEYRRWLALQALPR
jgi:dipeptidyl aminopeptidase/acylaminoacyl peptidase